jgi:CheY-like chemotaxis protein
MLKDEFLANMSHELRTPLNAILGITEGLSDESFGPLQEKQKSMLKVVENSGKHLLELINDILDLAKIEANEMTLDCQFSNIKDICQSSMMFVRQMAIQKNLQLDLRGAPSELATSLDERRIRQVLINLLSNAIKFTPSGGKITLEYALHRESISNENSPQAWVSLTVIDTGIGITSDNLHKLFQPFIQIDSPLNRQYDGTGLGLALVKKIVELHGGYVRATSEVGVGSQFAIALPYSSDISEQPQKPANIPPSPSEIIDGERYLPLVLLAEDNEDNFLTLTTYLVAKGFQLKIARNGQQAIDLVQIEPPDLILMDIQMPEVDGLEAIKYIRSQGFTMPIIATTALVMTGDRERCLAAGADDYISKPIKLKLLLTTIQQLFSKKNQSNNES